MKLGIRPLPFLLVALLAMLPVAAQQSASYKLSDSVLNAGGHPSGGTVMTSAGAGLGSASFSADAGFGVCYPPPGEVGGLGFDDAVTLVWNPEKSVGGYNLYRDTLAGLSGSSYGNCLQRDLANETATDADPVPAGDGFFYLVTAENRLGEEGTWGADSAGAPRTGGVCP